MKNARSIFTWFATFLLALITIRGSWAAGVDPKSPDQGKKVAQNPTSATGQAWGGFNFAAREPGAAPVITDHLLTGDDLTNKRDCTRPAAKFAFAATDSVAWHWFSATGVSVGDVIKWEWVQPDRSVYTTSAPFTANFSGGGCFWGGVIIAGQRAATLTGNWQVNVIYNNNRVLTDNFSIGSGSQTRICRGELSVFFHGMQSLGTVWGRSGCESGPLSPRAVSDMQAALTDTVNSLSLIPCVRFDVSRITALSGRLSSLMGSQVVPQVQQIITDLQLAVRQATANCDRGANLESLYVAGVNLGAAQAWAACFSCAPVPGNIQTVIANHLMTANNGLTPFAGCIPTFDFGQFGRVPLAGAAPGEPQTFIVGIECSLLWSIALSDCCCSCSRGTE